MSVRIDQTRVSPRAVHAMLGLEQYVRDSALEPTLVHLVKLRASYINGWHRLAVSFRTEPGT
jgi:hypothetical protein